MRRLHLVMPMAGGGTRFGGLFDIPKPLIPLHGRPFFYWAVESIKAHVSILNLIFVVLRDHVDRFEIDAVIHDYYPEAQIVVIPQILNGAVLTCLEAAKEIDDSNPILFNDCDHAFLCEDFYRFCMEGFRTEMAGALLTFQSNSPNYSYVRFSENGDVCGTTEKQVVSNEAICGAYYFVNRQLFAQSAEQYLMSCTYKEFFMSGVYNELLKTELKVGAFKTDIHFSFGTPDEYDKVKEIPNFGEVLR